MKMVTAMVRTESAIHDEIKIIVPDEKPDEVVNVILEHGRTGLAGDGQVLVQPADYVVKIRTKEKLI